MCCKFQFKMADGQRCVVLGVYMLETRLSKQSQHSHANYCSNFFSHSILTRVSGRGARLGLRSISTLFFWGVFSDVNTSQVTEVFFYFLFLLYLCKVSMVKITKTMTVSSFSQIVGNQILNSLLAESVKSHAKSVRQQWCQIPWRLIHSFSK